MGWLEVSVEDQRREFVMLASLEGANVSAICERFGISRQTGHMWLRRHAAGDESFADRSRRPLDSPRRMAKVLEEKILEVRDAHPAWGARKIATILHRHGIEPPAASSIHAVLQRHGRIVPDRPGRDFERFEKTAPNDLWQMDFKGRTRLANREWMHALTIIDDHSRFAVELGACLNQQLQTVRNRLERALRHHGLPEAIYVDNGPPWGGGRWTILRVWLLKLGIRSIYSRPYHPQGRGKNERFHRTLGAEVFNLVSLRDQVHAQAVFDRWRHVYNRERPHQALDQATPAERYRPSRRPYPETLPTPHYDEGEIVRKVDPSRGRVQFKGRIWAVSDALAGETVAIRPRGRDGKYDICLGAHRVASIDLNQPENSE